MWYKSQGYYENLVNDLQCHCNYDGDVSVWIPQNNKMMFVFVLFLKKTTAELTAFCWIKCWVIVQTRSDLSDFFPHFLSLFYQQTPASVAVRLLPGGLLWFCGFGTLLLFGLLRRNRDSCRGGCSRRIWRRGSCWCGARVLCGGLGGFRGRCRGRGCRLSLTCSENKWKR